jgi:hypothetical protein
MTGDTNGVIFTANFDPIAEEPYNIKLGNANFDVVALNFVGRVATVVPPSGVTTFWAGVQHSTTFISTALPDLGNDWRQIPLPLQPERKKIYLPMLMTPPTSITVTDDGTFLYFQASAKIPANHQLKAIVGNVGLPQIPLVFDSNNQAKVKLDGAKTFWFEAKGYEVVISYFPLGNNWYSIP